VKGETLVRLGAICLALSGGCAHASTRTKGTTPPASRSAEVDALRSQLAERDKRIDQLEGRLSLIEAEQRQHRLALESLQQPPPGIRETVRISSPSASDDGLEERPRATVRRDSRPVLRLYEEPRANLSEGDAELMPVPDVQERLPRFVPSLPGAQPAAAPLGAEQHYRQAIDLVRQRNFDAALISLNDFLVRHADDPRAPRVLFWRGEVLFAQRDYARALGAFETSLAQDPGGEKAPDAWLRVARCHLRLGAKERARAAIERLKAQFPNSDAARLAAQEDA
jgi:tol-pal system protein YbgF